MKWRERGRVGERGEMCASQEGQKQGESVVHLQLIHTFLPLCSEGAARRVARLSLCACVCVRDERENAYIVTLMHSCLIIQYRL